jgi:hypothetical protein
MTDIEREYREAHAVWLRASMERQTTLREARAADILAAQAWERVTDIAGRLPPEVRERIAKEGFVS